MIRGSLKTHFGGSRPNKLARGMQNTWDRSKNSSGLQGSKLSSDALSMVVRGTTDTTGRGFMFKTKSTKGKLCKCCGQARPRMISLSDWGRRYLKSKRKVLVKRRPLLAPRYRPLSWMFTSEAMILKRLEEVL